VRVRRARVLAASPEDVWRVVGDPHHLPRWWPMVERVEAVEADAWTSVLRSRRSGRAVRADYRVTAHEPPVRRAWAQELAGSPFERLLRSYEASATVTPQDGGTEVALAVEQHHRGTARLGSFMARRAARRTLDAALDGLVTVLE
jgi:uncharacterized protein YndB with AHSA1/START domain